MELKDFKIGSYFYTAAGKWKVVDKGKLFVLAVADGDTRNGTYKHGEEIGVKIFDKWDFGGCDLTDRF